LVVVPKAADAWLYALAALTGATIGPIVRLRWLSQTTTGDIVTALQTIKAKSAIERNYHIRIIASSQ
jgi:hypothetical protein